MVKDTGKVNIHGKEYSTVAYRVNKLRDDLKQDVSIETDLISSDDTYVIMKATIKDKEGRVIATGHAEERRDSTMINKTSALENCETSAIGRALAAFGLAGTEFASADEVATAISNQGETSSFDKPSVKQIALIKKIAKEKGFEEDVIQAKVESIKTKAEASKSIKALTEIEANIDFEGHDVEA